jgi:hypothetical protein
MERFFKDPRTIRKFRTGPLGLNIQQLADELFQLGYTRPRFEYGSRRSVALAVGLRNAAFPCET